jgi:hypothetical protein
MPRNRSAMILVTQSELLELVEELRGMAAAAPTAKVRDALTRMADRYMARAADAIPGRASHGQPHHRTATRPGAPADDPWSDASRSVSLTSCRGADSAALTKTLKRLPWTR